MSESGARRILVCGSTHRGLNSATVLRLLQTIRALGAEAPTVFGCPEQPGAPRIAAAICARERLDFVRDPGPDGWRAWMGSDGACLMVGSELDDPLTQSVQVSDAQIETIAAQ